MIGGAWTSNPHPERHAVTSTDGGKKEKRKVIKAARRQIGVSRFRVFDCGVRNADFRVQVPASCVPPSRVSPSPCPAATRQRHDRVRFVAAVSCVKVRNRDPQIRSCHRGPGWWCVGDNKLDEVHNRPLIIGQGRRALYHPFCEEIDRTHRKQAPNQRKFLTRMTPQTAIREQADSNVPAAHR